MPYEIGKISCLDCKTRRVVTLKSYFFCLDCEMIMRRYLNDDKKGLHFTSRNNDRNAC